jgi:hypothetical protein
VNLQLTVFGRVHREAPRWRLVRVHQAEHIVRVGQPRDPRLFRDTAQCTLRLRSVMVGETTESRPTVAFWFDFHWDLSDGTPAPFTVVDDAELDQDGRILRLHILYDTASLRESFDALRG